MHLTLASPNGALSSARTVGTSRDRRCVRSALPLGHACPKEPRPALCPESPVNCAGVSRRRAGPGKPALGNSGLQAPSSDLSLPPGGLQAALGPSGL